MITFQFQPEKFANAVAYLVSQRPGLTKKQIAKLMYFADKQHLLRYGRTITGDHYYALAQGHIPSAGLDMINGNPAYVGRAAVDLMAHYGHLKPDGREFELTAKPDLEVFSKTDIRILDEVLTTLGNNTAHELEVLSHQEPSWKHTPPNAPVDFELFFEGHPEATVVKEALLEDCSTVR